MYDQLKLDNQLCFRMYTASRLITQAYRPLLEPLGLTYPQYLVMMVLWEQDRLTVGDISRRLSLDTNTLTPLLQRMEREGLVDRAKTAGDGRCTVVSLSSKGRALEERAKDVPTCLSKCFLDTAPFADGERIEQLVATLDQIIGTLKRASA